MRRYQSVKKLPVFGDPSEHFVWNREIGGAFEDFPECHVGGNSIVLKPDQLANYFPEITARFPNLPVTVKINFQFQGKGFTADRYIIKNIAWMLGFAPRVYDVIEVEDTDGQIYQSQIIEYIIGQFADQNDAPILWSDYGEKLLDYYVDFDGLDWYQANFKDDKLLDFDEFYFKNKAKYSNKLYKRYKQIAYWGNSSSPYQDIPSLNIKGCRSYDRFAKLGMTEMDLTGKTVLDIGCSGGQVLFWAKEQGADRIVGLDTPEIAQVVFEMANFHQCFEIETVGCDLTQDNIQQLVKEKTGLDQFDVVVMFSVNAHIGFHQYMKDLCRDTLLLECNAAEMEDIERAKYPEELRKLGYREFEYKGQVNESGGRSLFLCQ